MLQNNVDQPRCVQQLSHGDLVVLEAVQTSTAYAVQVADPQGGSPALLFLSGTPAQRAVGQWACLEVVEQGEWLGLRSPLLDGLFVQARKKSPHLVFFSPRLGVWEQWKAEPVYQGVLQQHSPALCLTSRQVPTITLSVRAWKIGSVSAPLPPHVNAVHPRPEFHTAQDVNPGQWAEEAPAAEEGEDANCGASVTSSLQDDALELSHNVVKGYVVRVLKWPLYLAFRVWRAAARAGRLRRAEAAAHHERWLQSTAWVAIQQRAAVERHDRHMIVLACQCWAKQRARRVARAMQAWHARAHRSARLERLCRLNQQKRRRSRTAAVLAAWSRYTLEQHTHRLQCRTVRSRLAEHQARSVLNAWRDKASEQRRTLRTLQQRRRQHLLRAALSHWSGVTSQLLAARQAVHTSVAAAATTALLAIFQTWRALCNRRRLLAARTQVLVAAAARRRLGALWCAWRSLVDDTVSRRRRVDLLHVIREQHLAGRVLRRWMVLVRQAATLRFAAAQLALRHERRLLPRAFAAWHAATGLGNNGLLDGGGPDEAVARVMVVLRRRLTAERRRAMARGVLAAWRRLSSPREPARFAALAFSRMRDRIQARAVLTHWGACVQLSKEVHLEVLQRRKVSILRSALRAWAGQAAYCKRLGCTAALVTRRSRFHRLRSSFGTWQRQTWHGLELWSRALQAHGGFLTRRIMAAWRQRCCVVRAFLAGLAHCRKGYEAELLKSAIQALRAKAERRRAVRHCQRERARALARHAMKAWRSTTVYGVRLRGFSARLQANLRRCIARGVLRSWFLVSHAAVLQLHVLEAMRAASLTGPGRVGHGSAVATHATPSTGAALHEQRNPCLHPALPLLPSAQSLRPVLLRLLVTSLGGATVTGGRGGASATLEVAELLRTRLPALARLAARTRQQASAFFNAWRLAARDGARLRATVMRLQRRCRHLALRNSLNYWAAAVADVRDRRSAAMRMVRRTVRGLIARCLAAWRQQARHLARLRRTCLMLLGRRTTRLKKAALAAWREEVRAAHARMQEARKLRGDARTALLGRAVCAWRVAVEDAAEVRATAEKRYAAAWNRTKRQLLHSWRQVVVLQKQGIGTCVRVLQARAARRLMAQIIMAWSSFARLERQRREDWPQLCRVFYAWRTLVQPAGRAAAAAAAKLVELEVTELGSARVLRRSVAQDANEQAANTAPTAAPPAKPTDASTSSAGLHPSATAQAADSTAANVQRPASPPPEELSMPHRRGAGPHEDRGQQGIFPAPAGPGALTPASYLWQQWYHMMHGGGLGGLPSGPVPLPLPPGNWGIVPGAAAVAAVQAESAAEAGVLRERLEKLEEAMKQQQQPREGDQQGSSKDSAAQAVIAAASPPACRPQPPPPAPAQVSSPRVMTASCRPEPGPLYQVRQQQASVTALGGASSKSVTYSANMASQGANANGNVVASPPLQAQNETQGSGGDAAVAGAGTSSVAQTSAPAAAEAAQPTQAVGSAATPSAAQALMQPAEVQGTPSKALTASCHPESGPLYQVRAGSSTIIGRASISCLPGPEGLGSPSDSVISSVMSAEAGAPATAAPPLAPHKDVSERQGPESVKIATADTPSPPSPPRPSAHTPGTSYKTLTASCRPEPRPQCQVNRGTSSAADRASSKSLTGLEPTDSVNSSVTSIPAASAQPAQAVAPPQAQATQADGKDHQALASADSTSEVAAAASSTSVVARLSPPAAAVMTASCPPEPGPLCQIRRSTSTTPSRTSVKSVDGLETTNSIISSFSARATAGSLASESKEGSPAKDSSPANSGADGTASVAFAAAAPSVMPAVRPAPPPPAPAQVLTSRVLTASCLPEPGPLYQIRQGSTTTVGRASSRSLSGFEPMDSLANSSVTGASSPSSATPALAPPPAQPQTVHVVIHPYGPPPPTGLREADSRSGSSSATTAEGSSSLGSPTSLQAWSRRTTADLSGVSEEAEQRSEEARRRSMDLALGAAVPPATAKISEFCGGQQQEWGWQQQRHAGSSDSTQDVLAAAARRLLSGRGAAEDQEAQRHQPQAQAHVELQPSGRGVAAEARSQSAAMFAQPTTGPTMSFAPEPSSLPQQRQQHGLPQYPALPEGGGPAQPVVPQQPPQLSGGQVDSTSLAASLATAGAVLLPGGQIAQLVLPLQGAIPQDPRPGTVSSLLQSQAGLSQPPLEHPLLIVPQSPPAAPPLHGVQASAQQAAQGFHVATHVHDIQQQSELYGGSQRPTPGSAPAAGGLLAPAQLGTGYPYPILQYRPVQVSTAQAQASVIDPWQPSLAPQGDQAAAFFPAAADGPKGAQGMVVHPLVRGPQAGGQNFSSNGEVRVAAMAVPAASAAPAPTTGAPDMSELEAMLGELEARSRSAMSSPRRLQQPSAGSDAARPLPLLGTRSVAAATEGRSLGSGRPGAGGGTPLLGLLGLDGIDALHVRATTLSAPGAAIFSMPAGSPSIGDSDIRASGATSRPSVSAPHTFSGHALARHPDSATGGAEAVDPVDAALRRLEAASIRAHVAAAAWSAATGEVAAAAADSAAAPPGDREMTRLAAAVEAAAAAATAAATEQPGHGRLGSNRADACAGAAIADSTAGGLPWPHLTRPPGWVPGTGSGRVAGHPGAGGSAADLLATFLPGAEQLLARRHPASEPQPPSHDGSRQRLPTASQELHVGPQNVLGPPSLSCSGYPESISVRPPEPPLALGRQNLPSAQPCAEDAEGSIDEVCPTCGSPTRVQRSPSPPRRVSVPSPQTQKGRHPGAAGTGESGRQQQQALWAEKENSRTHPAGHEAAERRKEQFNRDGRRPADGSGGGGSAGDSNGGACMAPVISHSAAAHRSEAKQPTPLPSGKVALNQPTAKRQQGAQQECRQQEQRHQQRSLQQQQQQQQRQSPQRTTAVMDPLQEVVELAKRRGNHHLAVTLAELAGEAPLHTVHAAVCYSPARHSLLPPSQPPRVTQTASECLGVRPDTQVSRPQTEPSAHTAPACNLTVASTASQPLQSVRSVDSTGSKGSSSAPGGSISGSSYAAAADEFDPDPLQSPLRRMLGECRRLQSTAAWREEQGDAVVREVVAELSPRRAVAAALAAMLQSQPGPGAQPAVGLAGRRLLAPAGRRL